MARDTNKRGRQLAAYVSVTYLNRIIARAESGLVTARRSCPCWVLSFSSPADASLHPGAHQRLPTRNAKRALAKTERTGALETDRQCDLDFMRSYWQTCISVAINPPRTDNSVTSVEVVASGAVHWS
eukprot:6478251-Amphidinium_carterae.1